MIRGSSLMTYIIIDLRVCLIYGFFLTTTINIRPKLHNNSHLWDLNSKSNVPNTKCYQWVIITFSGVKLAVIKSIYL